MKFISEYMKSKDQNEKRMSTAVAFWAIVISCSSQLVVWQAFYLYACVYSHTLLPDKWKICTQLQNGRINSFSSLSYERSKASSKASSPHSAIQSFLLQMGISFPFLKVIQ